MNLFDTKKAPLFVFLGLTMFVAAACSGNDTNATQGPSSEDMTVDMADMSTPPSDMMSDQEGGEDLGGEDLPDASMEDLGGDLGGQQDLGEEMGVDMADMAMDMQNVPCLPPDANTQTREGQPSDGWRWTKGGRVFPNMDEADIMANDGDFSPSLISEPGGGYRLYFARRRSRTFELWTSTSADGETWSDPERLMGLMGENYPAALRQADGSVRLWFGSGSFDVATSQDGVTFTDQQRRILTPTQVGSFAQTSLIYPEVRPSLAGDGYRMWFTGFDGQQLSIGTAYSPDGVSWTPEASPVLTRREAGDFDNKAVGQPEVHLTSDALYMWHGGYDTSNTDPGPWRIGLSRSSDDGSTWERVGVSLPLAETGDDMWSTRDPAVIKKSDGSGWLMVYVGMRNDSVYRLLTATSDACID